MAMITYQGAPMDAPTTIAGLTAELRHRAAVIGDSACDTGGYALGALHDAIADLIEELPMGYAARTAERWAGRCDFGSGAWKRDADELVGLLSAFAAEYVAP